VCIDLVQLVPRLSVSLFSRACLDFGVADEEKPVARAYWAGLVCVFGWFRP
jgi:hypothetical protein